MPKMAGCPAKKRLSGDQTKRIVSDALAGAALIGKGELATLLATTTRTVDRRRHEDGFPKPVITGRRQVRWRLAAVQAWLAELEQNQTVLAGVPRKAQESV
jgi:predicted DNA-binding transcriptional regulator AlpA